MLFLLAGLITLAILFYIAPIATVSPTDGKCRIGFPLRTTVTALTWDVVMNILLSGVFCYLLYPFLVDQSHLVNQPECYRRRCIDRGQSCRHQNSTFSKLRTLWDKTIIGSALMMFATAANIFVLLKMEGHEIIWYCFLTCPLDGMLRNGLSLRCTNVSQSPVLFLSYIGLPSIPLRLIPVQKSNERTWFALKSHRQLFILLPASVSLKQI